MLIHSSYSHNQLEIKGCWVMQGPQSTESEHGAPNYIGKIFEDNPDIQVIAINTKKSGIVYSRI